MWVTAATAYLQMSQTVFKSYTTKKMDTHNILISFTWLGNVLVLLYQLYITRYYFEVTILGKPVIHYFDNIILFNALICDMVWLC